VNAKAYYALNARLRQTLSSQPIANVILQGKVVTESSLSSVEVRDMARALKLPQKTIMRLHELILFSALDTGAKREEVERAYRLAVKRRYYLTCMREYVTLFKGSEILQTKGGLTSPYIYSASMLEQGSDPFCQEESKEAEAGDDKLSSEGMKIQIKEIYNQIVDDFGRLKSQVQKKILASSS